MIRISQVRVVDEEGNQLGVMPTPRALQLAQERGYDLVEVAPMASPPVARLLDYGQFKYEQARKEKEARRHQRSVEFKEVRLRVKIGKGDFDTKVRRAIEFLEDGDRVKVTVQFRGREVSHAYIGRDLLTRFAERLGDHGSVERQPLLEGRSMSMVVTSNHKPKTQASPSRPEAPARAPVPEPTPGAAATVDGPPRGDQAPVPAAPPQAAVAAPRSAAPATDPAGGQEQTTGG
jgi:translation initiation factor IF-3